MSCGKIRQSNYQEQDENSTTLFDSVANIIGLFISQYRTVF